MRIWVDTNSGTWGNANDIRIVTFPESLDDKIYVVMESMTDVERSDFALRHGRTIPVRSDRPRPPERRTY
jgi:hypothetical protein